MIHDAYLSACPSVRSGWSVCRSSRSIMQRHQDVVCKASQIASFAKLQTWCASDACFGATGETRPVSCSMINWATAAAPTGSLSGFEASRHSSLSFRSGESKCLPTPYWLTQVEGASKNLAFQDAWKWHHGFTFSRFTLRKLRLMEICAGSWAWSHWRLALGWNWEIGPLCGAYKLLAVRQANTLNAAGSQVSAEPAQKVWIAASSAEKSVTHLGDWVAKYVRLME